MTHAIRATLHSGMVNIDGDSIMYANIRGMYKIGDGTGLQCELSDKGRDKSVKKICNEIAALLYTLGEHLK